MLTKLASLDFSLPKKIPAILILNGQEYFLLDKMADAIKTQWRNLHTEVDSSVIEINSPEDWLYLEQAFSSYSLFSPIILLDVRFSKKSLDATGKAVLERYLAAPSKSCLILLRALDIPLKSLFWLSSNSEVNLILFTSPSAQSIKSWIALQLSKISKGFDPNIPTLIHEHTEGNLLALDQVLKKLACVIESESKISIQDAKEQLNDLCIFSLFELADCCLSGDLVKSLRILRQARAENTEPSLILWILSQEVRKLDSLESSKSFQETAANLKIWSSKLSLYQKALLKYDQGFLQDLLNDCHKLDKNIKTNQTILIWQTLDNIAISLCKGKMKLWKAG